MVATMLLALQKVDTLPQQVNIGKYVIKLANKLSLFQNHHDTIFVIDVGGMFENGKEDEVQTAFTRAVSAVNADPNLLGEVEIVANPTSVSMFDSFGTARTG